MHIGQGSNLTQAQFMLWAAQQLYPDNPVYNVGQVFRISDAIDVDQFQSAFQALVNRSDILRTIFIHSNGDVRGEVLPEFPYQVEYLDFSDRPDPEQSLREWADKKTKQIYALDTPPFRSALVKLAPQSYVWYFGGHHLIFDGWTAQLHFNRLSVLYGQAIEGELDGTQPFPSYQAFVAHDQEIRSSTQGCEAASYWESKFAEPLEPLRFYGNPGSGALAPFKREAVSLGLERTQRLREFTSQEGFGHKSPNVALLNILFTALLAYLNRISGNRRIAVAMPYHNRETPEFKQTAGLLLEVLPICMTVDEEDTFRSLAKRLVTQVAEDLKHRPFHAQNRMDSRTYDVAINYHLTSYVEFNGTAAKLTPVDSGYAFERLTLHVHDISQTGALGIGFDFDATVFDASTRQRVIQHFLNIVDALIDDPDQPVATANILSPEEEHQVLVEFQTDATFPEYANMAELFEERVRTFPDRTALTFEDGESVTYAELNARANQLARHLEKLGVLPETVVAICLDRSIEMIVAMLGVLKAGGAFLPLDPFYPKERLAFMLEDCQARFIVTRSRLADHLPDQGARTVLVDAEASILAGENADNAPCPATLDSLAYVIFTSGSTGQPKGSLLVHRGLCNFTQGLIHALGITEEERILQFSSFSFDMSLVDICGALGSGAALCLAGQETLATPSRFAEYAQRQRITFAILPPALLMVIRPEDFPTFKTVISGGDRCPAELTNTWGRACRLINGYGPTETSVAVVLGVCEGTYTESPPIGKPVANARIYVLDDHLQPVPIGVVGGLYVGGVAVGRGYLNRQELTAQRFIPDPFDEAGRLYSTGDRARFLPDGNIEFLGRLDNQIKIRGYRVELGEIETRLSQHAQVREAIVVARENGPGDKQLVAYVVSEREPAPEPGALKSFLRGVLPDYMVPSAYVVLDAFPLSPNGKVDRNALPEPEATTGQETFVAPDTDTEEMLARIWAEVLRLDRVGIHDNFFDIGGDSLLTFQVIARANQAGLHLTPHDFFQQQTIAGLARVATRLEDAESTIHAEQASVEGSTPLTPIQRWFLDQHLSLPNRFCQAVLVRAPAGLRPDLVEAAAQRLVDHHDALGSRFILEGSGSLQVYGQTGGQTPLFRVDLSATPESDRQAAIETVTTERQAGMNLEHGPLFQAVLFELGADDGCFVLLLAHHMVVDGVSWPILLEDFATAYAQLERDVPVVLPRKTTSFKHWVERLCEYAHSPALDEEQAFWLAEPESPPPALPFDHPEGDVGAGPADLLCVSLSEDETRALLHEAPSAYQTRINDVFLTALAQTCAEWSGERRLLVGVEGHGREDLFDDVDVSRTVGWFTTLFPVTLALPDSDNPGEALKSVKAQLRRVPNHGIGCGLLRYLSDTAETMARLEGQPKPQISFNYLGEVHPSLGDASPIQMAEQWVGMLNNSGACRFHPLEINAVVARGQLHIMWSYSEGLHDRETVRHIAETYADKLRTLIDHCRRVAVDTVPNDPSLEFSVVPIRPDGSRPPLFCVAPAGGVVFPYYNLAPLLHPDQPFYALQDPSVDPAREPYRTVEDLAAHYIRTMRTVQPEGPYRIAGWSFGGIVAFEMAQQLERDGDRAALVGIIDAPSPDTKLYPGRNGLAGIPKLVVQVTWHVLLVLPHVWPYIRDGLFLVFSYKGEDRERRDADRPSFFEYIRWAWRDALWQSLLKEADMKEIVSQNERLLLIRQPKVRRVFRLLNANIRSMAHYKPKVYPGQLVVFRAEEQLGESQLGDLTMGWQAWAEDGVDIRTVPGNHVVFFRKPYIESFAEHLNGCLEQVRRDG